MLVTSPAYILNSFISARVGLKSVMAIFNEGSRIKFSGKSGDDVLPAIAALHRLIVKQGYKDIEFDFSAATYLDARVMVPLVSNARAYRSSGVDYDIIEPVEPKTARLLKNTNWAHLLAPEKYEVRDVNINHLSALQYTTAADQFSAVDKSMDIILKGVGGLDRSKLKALEWSLNEITDNVLNHADSPIGGIIQVVTFPAKHIVEFYVCDAGIGIPKSLRSGHPDITSDTSAVRAAIEEGVTRNKSTNQGNGLFGTFNCCNVSGGEFDILTGNISLKHKPGQLNVTSNLVPFKGTFVRASINYGFDKLLEKALIFKGKAHDPSNDYIERVYQSDGDDIKFAVVAELNAFGSRAAGQEARTKIENLMDNQKLSIEFDFSDVHLISSSFADEVFGRLFVDLGPIGFSQLCKFKNVDSTVRKLIDRAISQRLRN